MVNLSKVRPGDVLIRAEVDGEYIHFRQYEVLRVTPKGFWYKAKAQSFWGRFLNERWASFDTRKLFWSHKEALRSLQVRKRRYVQHCEERLEKARKQLEVALEGGPVPDLKTRNRRSYSPHILTYDITASGSTNTYTI